MFEWCFSNFPTIKTSNILQIPRTIDSSNTFTTVNLEVDLSSVGGIEFHNDKVDKEPLV